MKKYVIIVAGGVGERMKTEIPKQFIPVHGRPLLMHTFNQFLSCNENFTFLLVLPSFHVDTWKGLCRKHHFKADHTIVQGGSERYYSVKNALDNLKTDEEALVAVHDGVRPMIDSTFIMELFKSAAKNGNAVPALAPSETIRHINEEGISTTVNRQEFRLIQTPQIFQLEDLREAYRQQYQKDFTDDASVVEATGKKIHLLEGRKENIKITLPVDLKIAKALLASS